MKRFIAGALAAALLVAGLTLTAQPAYAHTESCSGSGVLWTGPVYHATLGPSATGLVTFNFTIGGCLVSGATTIYGTYTTNNLGNFCEHSTGKVAIGPDVLDWVQVGNTWTFSGSHGGGSFVVEANRAAGQSCVSGATQFLFTGLISTV